MRLSRRESSVRSPEHLASEKIHPIERGTDWLLKKCSYIGENTTNWTLGLVANRGIEAVRVLHGLLNLIDKHPSSVIEQACEVALRQRLLSVAFASQIDRTP